MMLCRGKEVGTVDAGTIGKMKRWLGIQTATVLVLVVGFGTNVCEAGTNVVNGASANTQGFNPPLAVPATPAQARPIGLEGVKPLNNPTGITPINPSGPVPIQPRGVTLPNPGGSTPANRSAGATPIRPGGATPVNPGGPAPANPGAAVRGNSTVVTPRNSGGVPVLVIPRQTTMAPPVNPIIIAPKPVQPLPGTMVPVPGSGIAPMPSPKVPPKPAPTPTPAPTPGAQHR
jgi:hypothetical protein